MILLTLFSCRTEVEPEPSCDASVDVLAPEGGLVFVETPAEAQDLCGVTRIEGEVYLIVNEDWSAVHDFGALTEITGNLYITVDGDGFAGLPALGRARFLSIGSGTSHPVPAFPSLLGASTGIQVSGVRGELTFPALQTVGNLTVNETDLTSLTLGAVPSGDVSIRRNAGLVSVDLQGTGPSDAMEIEDNPSLASFTTGASRAEALTLRNNPALTDLHGFSALSTLGGLSLWECPGLTDLAGLDALTSATNVQIWDNPDLRSLEGLGALATVSASIDIHGNAQLASLTGLEALRTVGPLVIYENPSLTDISALHGLESTGLVDLFDNDALCDDAVQDFIESTDAECQECFGQLCDP